MTDQWPLLLESSLPTKDPFKLFSAWQNDAKIIYPWAYNIVNLATASIAGKPSNRMLVLEYSCTQDGFVFSTNKNSPKVCNLTENPFAAMCFWWYPRCVRIEGKVIEMSRVKSSDLFDRIDAKCRRTLAAFPIQSAVCRGRAEVDKMLSDAENVGAHLAIPEFWASYQLIPESIEFVHSREDWSTDRLKFRRKRNNDLIDEISIYQGDDDWVFERLAA